MTAGRTGGEVTGGPLLVVNADDFGLTEGVSRAILDAHRRGVVTSTSVLALGPGFTTSAAWLADAPALGVGAHLAAVGEDPPLLSAAEVPTLVDRRGRLRLSWRQFLPLAAAGRIDPADLRREFTAQLKAITDAGVTIDHLDTHQNLHLWPMVRDVLVDVGEASGVRALRVTRSARHGPIGQVVRRLARQLESVADDHSWRYPMASTGFDEAGALDVDGMCAALKRLRAEAGDDGSAELATHPGELTAAERGRYRWNYSWEAEFTSLCSSEVRATIDQLGFRLGTFADLSPPGHESGPAGSATP
jgi:chitin disaccharide deacetylase